VLRPTQPGFFSGLVGIEGNTQLTINFPAERGRHHQLCTVLQLQFISHQHTNFVGQDLIKLLEARQNREVQHDQVSRHQAGKQQGDDEQ
jgi:hypothetical protein